MRFLSPPPWLTNWRTDPAVAVLGSILACGVLVGVIQSRSASQVERLRTEILRERAESSRRFDAVQAVLARLSRTVASEQHSALAAESGRKAIAEGRWGAGQIYLINAITNEPQNIEHLKAYTNAVLGHERPPEEALDQLGSILQMAACHVPPEDVSAVLAQIAQVDKVKSRLKAEADQAAPGGDSPTADGLDAEWTRLQVTDADRHRDPVRLAGHLRALENFATTLDDQAQPDEARTRAVADEIRRWSEVAQAARNVAYIDQCLARLTDPELAQTDNDRAIAIVQAAEAVLPTFWGIRPGTLPDELQQKINAYPASIKGRVDAIGLKKSRDLMKLIEAAFADPGGNKKVPEPPDKAAGTLERNSFVLQEQIKRAQVLAAQLPSPDQILEAQKRIEPRTQALQQCRTDQYSKYQTRVIGWCATAFKDYQSYTTGLSEADALKVFHDNQLQWVDQALLTPEVARMFNDILAKLMAELGPEKLVKTEGEMGSAKKLRLEDF